MAKPESPLPEHLFTIDDTIMDGICNAKSTQTWTRIENHLISNLGSMNLDGEWKWSCNSDYIELLIEKAKEVWERDYGNH